MSASQGRPNFFDIFGFDGVGARVGHVESGDIISEESVAFYFIDEFPIFEIFGVGISS